LLSIFGILLLSCHPVTNPAYADVVEQDSIIFPVSSEKQEYIPCLAIADFSFNAMLAHQNGVEYQITVKKNEGCILILGKGAEEVKDITDGELLYREMKQKARTWYWDEELCKHTVVFNNTRCKVHLDIYSWIPPFVLKSIEDINTRFIGLDFLTVYSLISND